VIIFAPTGRVDAHHDAFSGLAILIATFAGGTCKTGHNTPDVPCLVF